MDIPLKNVESNQYKDTCCDNLMMWKTSGALSCGKNYTRLGSATNLGSVYGPGKADPCLIYKKNRYCPLEKEHAEAEKKALEEKEAAEKKAREEKEAAEKLRKEAEQGNAEAQFKLGNSYFTGQGEKQDDAKAAEWFGKAAAQGHAEAKGMLAKIEAETANRIAAAKRNRLLKFIGVIIGSGVGGGILALLLFLLSRLNVGGTASIILFIVFIIGGGSWGRKWADGFLAIFTTIVGAIVGFIGLIVLVVLATILASIPIPAVVYTAIVVLSTVAGLIVAICKRHSL